MVGVLEEWSWERAWEERPTERKAMPREGLG